MTDVEKLIIAGFILTALQFVWINVVPQHSKTRRNK